MRLVRCLLPAMVIVSVLNLVVGVVVGCSSGGCGLARLCAECTVICLW